MTSGTGIDFKEWTGRTVAEYRFKAVRPTSDINTFSVHGDPQGDGQGDGKTFHLWARGHEGWLTMDATAVIR